MNGYDTLTTLDSPRARSLADFLFPAPAARNPRAILLWWERRRLAYNLIVGGVGAVAATYLGVASFLLPGGPEVIPIRAFLAVGLAANLCYSFGAVVEIAVLKIFGRGVLPVGPALYRAGLTFSLGLPMIPVVVVTIAVVLTLLSALGLPI